MFIRIILKRKMLKRQQKYLNNLLLRAKIFRYILIILCESKVLQYFGSTWNTIHQFRMPRSWKWRNKVNCEMLSSPDTLPDILVRFASMVWSTASQSTIEILATWNFFNHLVAVLLWEIVRGQCISGCTHVVLSFSAVSSRKHESETSLQWKKKAKTKS